MSTANNTAQLALDDFDKSFSELSKLDDDAPPSVTIAKPDPAPAAPAADAAAADAAAAQAAAQVATDAAAQTTDPAEGLEDLTDDEKAAAAKGEDAPAKPAQQQSGEDPLKRLADLIEGRQQQTQQPTQPQQRVEAPPPIFTPDEVAALTTFQKEWPDVAQAQALMIRAAVHHATAHIFAEIGRNIGPKLALLDNLADYTTEQQLTQTIPDYNDVYGKVVEWAKNQPAYLQAAYNHVIEHGSVDEVQDLIDRYRRDAGAVQSQAGAGGGTQQQRQPATPSVPAKKPAAELSNAAKQAAERLAPISTKRTAVVQATDPLDFDGAFAEAAKAAAQA